MIKIRFLKKKKTLNKFYIILLAAGDSKRFDGNKLLYDYKGKPLYTYALNCYSKLKSKRKDIANVIVVTKYHEIMESVKSNKHLTGVYNFNSSSGISTSIKVGLSLAIKLSEDDMFEGEIRDIKPAKKVKKHYIFAVADQPFIKSSTVARFINMYRKSKKGLGVISYNDNYYNPVIFSDKYLNELLMLEGDCGGKNVVNKHKDDIFEYKISNKKEVTDIDERIDIK